MKGATIKYSQKSLSYWSEADIKVIETCDTFAGMLAVAFRILDRMPRPVIQVCGPISTGGRGSVSANLEYFNDAIHRLQEKGVHVFDQMPFEIPMQKVKELYVGRTYITEILTDFYLPLFKSGKIEGVYFLPDWQSSRGSVWEHEHALKFGIPITYLSDEDIA